MEEPTEISAPVAASDLESASLSDVASTVSAVSIDSDASVPTLASTSASASIVAAVRAPANDTRPLKPTTVVSASARLRPTAVTVSEAASSTSPSNWASTPPETVASAFITVTEAKPPPVRPWTSDRALFIWPCRRASTTTAPEVVMLDVEPTLASTSAVLDIVARAAATEAAPRMPMFFTSAVAVAMFWPLPTTLSVAVSMVASLSLPSNFAVARPPTVAVGCMTAIETPPPVPPSDLAVALL